MVRVPYFRKQESNGNEYLFEWIFFTVVREKIKLSNKVPLAII